MRASGILMPISSLPSNYGIGCFSKEAYEFVDQLKAAGQKYWQILPLGPTSFGDSPYQSFSAYAGNPYYIDFETLIAQGLLQRDECEIACYGYQNRWIEYEQLYLVRYEILKKAFRRYNKDTEEYVQYKRRNSFWLDDYALFMAVKNRFQQKSWKLWDEDIKLRKTAAIKHYKEECQEDIEFYKFQQYMFFEQWAKLKTYANQSGIRIIGDIPIYVAFDSADSWAEPELFQFDMNRIPTAVAGCPPDAFAISGQLWGNPLYDWDYHKKTDFDWWTKRIAYSFMLYDVVRVDHFRGFDEYYSIPYGNPTAEYGTWRKGPGYDIFEALLRHLGKLNIIAEDLGFLTDTVIDLVKKTGFPGMKILQFAFDSREESDYLPHNYDKNCVVYTGTHDNDTIKGWFLKLPEQDRALAVDYVDLKDVPEAEIPWKFIRCAMASVADLCIIPMQDYLGLGSEARLNVPSTVGGNWKWRMLKGEFTSQLCERIYTMTKTYCR